MWREPLGTGPAAPASGRPPSRCLGERLSWPLAGWKPALLETHPGPLGHPSKEGTEQSPPWRERGNVSSNSRANAGHVSSLYRAAAGWVSYARLPGPLFIFVHSFCSFLPIWAAIYPALCVYSRGREAGERRSACKKDEQGRSQGLRGGCCSACVSWPSGCWRPGPLPWQRPHLPS